MRLLLDACVWGGARHDLEAAGHDVIWAGDWDTDPGDEEILASAHRDGRVLVTLDKDFGELAVVRGKPHGGIVRIVRTAARDQARVCLAILARHDESLRKGAIITADSSRLRIRLADRQEE